MYLELKPSLIKSPCPLLPTEQGEEYLPAACMPVPSQSAWIALEVDVSAFVTADGDVDTGALRESLERCIDDGERRHDETDWGEPLIEYDSWLNRRLAIALRGWGDVVVRRGLEPGSIAALRAAEELATFACQVLHARSRSMALGSNWCPALDEAGARVLRKDTSQRWNRRWRRALAEVAVRHRNLTTMSPWDVFPQGGAADLAFANLLPVMRFADALSFQCSVSISHWNVRDFKGFHGRVAALVRCNGGGGLVAKHV